MKNFDDDDDILNEAQLRALEESVTLERDVFPEKSPGELAEKVLEDAAPHAALSIVRIATNDPNSRVRLSAAQYIIDRTLGKSGQDPTKSAPWEDVFKAVTVTQNQ
jgi:hypothetical protein